MKTTSLGGLLLATLCWLGVPFSAHAADSPPLPQPQKVILTPQNARLHGEARLTTMERQGQTVLLLTLPLEADDISLNLLPPHASALRTWRVAPVALTTADGHNTRARAALQAEMDALQGRMDALRAQKSVLCGLSANHQNATPAEMQQRLQEVERQVPAMTAELAQLERQWEAVKKRLALLPAATVNAAQATLSLHGVKPGSEVTVRYAYTLPQCGWKPVYIFDALPAQNTVQMRMLAEVWQNSGMDWSKAHIALTTAADARREPSRLSPWVIQKGRREARVMAAPAMLRQTLTAEKGMDNAAAEPESFESETQAGWVLPRGMALPEGRTRLPLLEETWQAPLHRLARPSVSDSLVWLTARFALQGRSLPNGEASFLLDGSATGSGRFAPHDGEAVLYFGADPMVTVQTRPDTRLTGKAGLIDKRQTWQWGWIYTVHNQRAQAVTVRLEEPAPQAGDRDIAVTLADKPEATRDKDNVLYWDVQAPPKGKAEVRHEVHISAPQDMDVWPGR